MNAPMISLALGHTAEYALRAMSQLALGPGAAPVRAADLSKETGVPLPYLLKIMRQLVSAGLVISAKGHGGGFRLARPLEGITFLEVLQVAGYGTESGICVFGWGKCQDDNPCPMHDAWSALNKGFRDWASTTTLAELRKQNFSHPPMPSRRPNP